MHGEHLQLRQRRLHCDFCVVLALQQPQASIVAHDECAARQQLQQRTRECQWERGGRPMRGGWGRLNQGFFNESWGSREKQCGVAKGRRWGKELLHALQDGGGSDAGRSTDTVPLPAGQDKLSVIH